MNTHLRITEADIQDMLFQIAVHGNKREAKRFDRLEFEVKQKVTLLLKRRAKRCRNAETPMDIYTIKEVIDDARNNKFFYD
jgi:hypothetical protein